MDQNRHKNPFPWRSGNHFELLVDGPAVFPRMLAAIGRARTRVWLEIYLLESGRVADRFIEALRAATARGVDVRVLADDYGAAKLHDHDRARLTAGGARLALYNPLRWRRGFANLFRDHRKLLIVDETVAFVSGIGLTDEFDHPLDPALSWHETALAIRGPVLADWADTFASAWREHCGEQLATGTAGAPRPENMSGRVTLSARLRNQAIRRSIYRQVRAARHCAWIATAYFVPSRRLLRALKRAARRGVDVRLLLPGPHCDHPGVRHAGRRFYGGLLRAGVRVLEYQPRFLHAKFALCDEWVTTGSSNFDRWNFRWNLEGNQEVDDPRLADAVRALFERDFGDSLEIRPEDWQRRGLIERAREQFWGRVDLLLESLGRLKGIRMQ